MLSAYNLPLEKLIPKITHDSSLKDKLIETAASRYHEHKKILCAYRHWSPVKNDNVGILSGIPVSIKDLFGLNGFKTYAGSPHPLAKKWCSEGEVVHTLRNAGAVLVGKTHMVEFAFGGLGTNPHWPTPVNPWSIDEPHVPGGSSSGAGVSIQEGSALAALGSDTAGSVRVPASFTGTVGLKTTKNRWSTKGMVPLSHSLDTTGILTRSVSDAVVMFSVIDPETNIPFDELLMNLRSQDVLGLKIGICNWFFDDCHMNIGEVALGATRAIEKKGAKLSEVTSYAFSEAGQIFSKGGLAASEFATLINKEFPDWKETLDPNVKSRFERMENISASDYDDRLQRLTLLAKEIDKVLSSVDVLVGPTVPICPPTIFEVSDSHVYRQLNMIALRNTSVVNLLNLCAITLPAGLDSKGFPVGLQLIGRKGEDEKLLAAALAAERILGSASEQIGKAPLAAY